jgi:putative ABC transport system substrate-binding protein
MKLNSVELKKYLRQKSTIGIILVLIPIAALILRGKDTKKKQVTVAITQIVEHPALDQERMGIVLALQEAGYIDGTNLKIIYQSAQGSPVTATQIAQKFVSLKPDVIVAISTPSAQSVLSAIGKNRIPLVFTAVTDPVGAHLVKDLHHPELGISGVSDYLQPKPQIQLIQKFIPTIKNIGIIYNPGESNSSAFFKELQDMAPSLGIHLIAATASRTSEVAAAAESLVGRVEAVYIPNDNTAVSAIESIVRVGIHHQLPVFAGDSGSVLRGAVGAAGYNRIQLGKTAGNQVVQFLKNPDLKEYPVAIQHPIEMTLNRKALSKMGLLTPPNLSAHIHWIGDSK